MKSHFACGLLPPFGGGSIIIKVCASGIGSQKYLNSIRGGMCLLPAKGGIEGSQLV